MWMQSHQRRLLQEGPAGEVSLVFHDLLLDMVVHVAEDGEGTVEVQDEDEAPPTPQAAGHGQAEPAR